MRMELFQLPHLAVGSPSKVAVARILQIHAGNFFEATRRIEAGGELVGERVIVNKAVGAGRANRLFVEPHRVDIPAIDLSDLGADQRGAVLEIVRAIRRPNLELLVMRSDNVQMLPPAVSGRIARGGSRQRVVEVIFRRFEL